MGSLVDWAITASGLQGTAKAYNTYYESRANNYLQSKGWTDAQVATFGDVYKHPFAALTETYNVALSADYKFGPSGAYTRTLTIGVANEIYTWYKGRDSAAEDYKDYIIMLSAAMSVYG